MSKRSRRASLLLPLFAVLAGSALASCADPVDGAGSVRARPDTPPLPVAAPPAETPEEEAPEEAAAADPAASPESTVNAPPDRIMQGPWRVVCYQEQEVVFRHDRIFRVWDGDNEPPQWVYQTEDGVRFRGRMGTDLNCTFQRLGL